MLARPFETREKRAVRPLGVSALWAALLVLPDTDADQPVALELHVCPIERSNDVAWCSAGVAIDAATSASARWASTLLVVAAPRAMLYALSRSEGAAAAALASDVRLASGERADACALTERFAAVVQQRTLSVWRRDGAGLQTYEHTCALRAVRLDACESAHSSLALCADEHGDILGFELALDGALPVLARAPFFMHAASGAVLAAPVAGPSLAAVERYDDAIVALAFAGSRFALASRTHLYVRDTQRAPKGCRRPLALRLRELGLGAVVALALWGEALLVHDDEARVVVVDARTGHVVKSCVGEQARAGVARASSAYRYQSIVCAGDQCGALLPNGALLFLDL